MGVVQIIGGNGMLGMAVTRAAIRNGWALGKKPNVDITTVKAQSIVAEVVINCSTIVGKGKPPALVESVNGAGPQKLAAACSEAGARLIQVSTDNLFWSEGWHTEDSPAEPVDHYTRTKLQGEVTNHPHLTVRVGFVGLGQNGVIADIVRGDVAVRASSRLLWSGHTVDTVAEMLIRLAGRPDVQGLLHVPGTGLSRWHMALMITELLGIEPTKLIRDDSTVADRRLASLRWSALGLPTLPPFGDQLTMLLQSPDCQSYIKQVRPVEVLQNG